MKAWSIEGGRADPIYLEELVKVFNEDGEGPVCDEMNWLFLSTSGVHGSYCTLDQLEDIKLEMEQEGSTGLVSVTFLALQPRKLAIWYGNVYVRNEEEERILRRMVTSTVEWVEKSQQGNLLDNQPDDE